MTEHDIFRGPVHGFITYGSAHPKPVDDPWKTNEDIQAEHLYSTHGGNPTPSLLRRQAATRLFSTHHRLFSNVADDSTRHILKLPFNNKPLPNYIHAHGIHQLEGRLEPAMVSMFRRPLTEEQLHTIARDVGAWTNQGNIHAFTVHPEGRERLAHLRFESHHPLIQQLDPDTISTILHSVGSVLNRFPVLGNHTILPDASGNTDVLIHVPENRVELAEDAFHHAARMLNGKVQYWNGVGKKFGQEQISTNENDPYQFARAPSHTGIVVRGVFYRPGSIIPDLISPNSPNSTEKTKLSADEFKKRFRIAYSKRKEKENHYADDDSHG